MGSVWTEGRSHIRRGEITSLETSRLFILSLFTLTQSPLLHQLLYSLLFIYFILNQIVPTLPSEFADTLCVLQWIEENYNATTMFITGKFTCQVIDKGLQKPEYIDWAIISAVHRHLPAS